MLFTILFDTFFQGYQCRTYPKFVVEGISRLRFHGESWMGEKLIERFELEKTLLNLVIDRSLVIVSQF